MGTKLCQVIALAGGKKSRVQAEITEVYRLFQKPELLKGVSRTYRPHLSRRIHRGCACRHLDDDQLLRRDFTSGKRGHVVQGPRRRLRDGDSFD